jgi:hypothetical protein
MKVNFYKIVYFIIKGIIVFCLDSQYGNQEIRELKKNINFGEVEMCLNYPLNYNIKVKSRDCELFVLKKDVLLLI